MFYRLRQKTNRSWFNFWTREVLKTPPLVQRVAPLVTLSMISHLDLVMYLVAIKSYYRAIGKGRVVVLDDGSLREQDIQLLKHHIPFIELVHISEVKTDPCPKGACWERLLLISKYVQDSYVVQLDSDSLVLDKMSEVDARIAGNRSFALGQPFLGLKIVAAEEIVEALQTHASDYVEIVAEKNFALLKEFKNVRYCRSSACFAGFAKGSFSRDVVERFSGEMEGLIGRRWYEWGTEKVTSNYIISNSPSASILPYPKYISYYDDPKIDYDQSVYLHFTATHRFMKGFYIERAREVIARSK